MSDRWNEPKNCHSQMTSIYNMGNRERLWECR